MALDSILLCDVDFDVQSLLLPLLSSGQLYFLYLFHIVHQYSIVVWLECTLAAALSTVVWPQITDCKVALNYETRNITYNLSN